MSWFGKLVPLNRFPLARFTPNLRQGVFVWLRGGPGYSPMPIRTPMNMSSKPSPNSPMGFKPSGFTKQSPSQDSSNPFLSNAFFTATTLVVATACSCASLYWVFGNDRLCQTLDVNVKSKGGTLTITPLDKPQIKSMVLKVIQDLNEKPVAEECVTLFQIRHMFPFVMGLPAKSVFCGIPLHFQWSDESQVDLKSIPPHVVWLYGSRFTTVELGLDESKVAKEDFKSFKECLILSEKAKRFAIAQQVFPTVNHHHFALFMLPFVAIHACFFAGFGLLKDPSMSQGMKRLKLPIAAGFALLAPLLAFIVMGHYYYNLVQRWDSYLTHSLDSEYVEGGVEYLEKTLKIGKLLRQYVKFGDYYFQEDGQQINYWFDVSQMSPDPNSRLSNFKEFLESKTESDGNSNKKE